MMLCLDLLKLGWALMPVFLMKLDPSLIASISLRSAYEQGCPYDYQYVAGYKTKWSDCRWEFEREDCNYDTGHDLKFDIGWLHFRNLKKEAYKLHNQTFSCEPTKTIKKVKVSVGGGYLWSGWRDRTPVAICGLGSKYLESSYKSNFNHRFVWDVVLSGKPIKITKKLDITPKIVYYKDSESLFWQAKMFGEIKLW